MITKQYLGFFIHKYVGTVVTVIHKLNYAYVLKYIYKKYIIIIKSIIIDLYEFEYI